MKITTELCKEKIVEKCKGMLEFIKNEFYPILTDEEVKKVLHTDNWKRDYKQKDPYSSPGKILIERMFDCRPFDSQLRAYVYTDETDSKILEIDVRGE